MKRGFLLTPKSERDDTSSQPLQPIETDECPVCLDPLQPDESIFLVCRHLLCTPCTQSLWQLRRETQASTLHLECPICRTLIKVNNGDLAAFCAAHTASNFIGPVKTPRRKPPDSLSGLNTLTVAELKVLIAHFRLQARVAGQLERDEIERAIEEELPATALGASATSAIARLPVRAMRAVLDERDIPHDDCVEKAELIERVLQSARGSCMRLPSSVLVRMLGEEVPPEDKVELARRVMAVRSLRRAAAAQRRLEAAAAAAARTQSRQHSQTHSHGPPPIRERQVRVTEPGAGIQCGCCVIA